MLKTILLIMLFTVSFTSADGQRAFYDNEVDYEEIGVCELQNENQILKLQLQVFKLKEQISELQKTLKKRDGDKGVQRLNAIKKLKRELKESRKISLDIDYK
jgi:uncharacterized protein YlxW (UPF0749 family)